MDQPSVSVESGPFECIPHWLLFQSGLSANSIQVYLILRKYRDYQNGTAFPGLPAIAAAMDVSVDTVRRAVVSLETAGALCRVARYRKDGGQTSNMYHVHWDSDTSCEGLSSKFATAPLAPEQPTPVANQIDEQRPIVYPDPLNKTQENKLSNTANEPFDEFWTAYPRKKDKAHARKAWAKAVKDTNPAVIVHAAVLFRQWCEQDGTEPQFIPHPSTWLNGERWTDERDPPPMSESDKRMQGHLALIQELWENENGSQPPNPLELEG